MFRSRNWPAYFHLDVYPISFGQQLLINESDSEQHIIAPMMELKLRMKDILADISLCSMDSKESFGGRPLAILNPLDDSRVNNSNIDEGMCS